MTAAPAPLPETAEQTIARLTAERDALRADNDAAVVREADLRVQLGNERQRVKGLAAGFVNALQQLIDAAK